jgi:hypothetical protein
MQVDVSWYQPDYLVTYDGELWELDPVEVRPRNRPPRSVTPLPEPEQQIFAEEGVSPEIFQAYLRQRDLALIVSRDVTGRDDGDQQQPFNLRVPGGVQNVAKSGKIYDVEYLQLFQADMIRGIGMRPNAQGGYSQPRAGRRPLAQVMHEPLVDNVPVTNNVSAPAGSVRIALDGSVAAIVPARRAMSWQTTDGEGMPVVRERYWITFQPGEIRTCANCHGVNRLDQSGRAPSENPPEALRALLRHWKTNNAVVVGSTEVEGDTFGTVSFKRQIAATALKQRVEYSSDLQNWLMAAEYSATNSTHYGPFLEYLRIPGAMETITLRSTNTVAEEPQRFFRVRHER